MAGSGRVQEMSQGFEGVWLGNKVHEITSWYEFFEYSSYLNKFLKLEIKEIVFNKKIPNGAILSVGLTTTW